VNPLPGGVTTGVGTPSFAWGDPGRTPSSYMAAFAPALESPF